MGGKPAARQGDMTRKGLDIVQGSAGVLIGAPTGVTCSVCPGGITYANPVNPVLGAKVLPGETDLALPGPLPFILSRAYSSYRTRTPAPVGVFGPGWKAPFDIRLQVHERELILNDNGGRSIHFEPLFPGEISYSRSESFWLARGGGGGAAQFAAAKRALAGAAGRCSPESACVPGDKQPSGAVVDTQLAGAGAGSGRGAAAGTARIPGADGRGGWLWSDAGLSPGSGG